MGLFNKLKNAMEDKLVNKVAGKSTYNNSSTRASPTDAAHEAKLEQLRKERDIQSLETEIEINKQASRFMNAAANTMEENEQLLKEQKKKAKRG